MVTSASGWASAIPATLSTASTRPKVSRAAANMASTWASSVTSQWNGVTASPRASAVSFSRPLTSTASTRAPSRTNTCVEARAIPDPAPVMIATLPSSSPIVPPWFPPDFHVRVLAAIVGSAKHDVRGSEGSAAVTTAVAGDLYYDPYDVEINANPYPVYRRLREEAPLYYNEPYDFWAVSRYEDVERGLADYTHLISGRGGILEVIRADIEMPSGVLIFSDPPIHTLHRRLLARVFTPRKMAALEPDIRAMCATYLDPLVGGDLFDFVADLSADMPARVICTLLGVPDEESQLQVRNNSDARIRTEAGKPMEVRKKAIDDGSLFADYLDWRIEHPSDDIMTQLLQAEFEAETGTVRRLTRAQTLTYVAVVAGAGSQSPSKPLGR